MSPERPWSAIVRERGFALVDGGLATELERRGHRLDGALWSAALLASNPGAIRAVHEDYLRAGADIVIAATYQASFAGFAAAGIDGAQAAGLMQLAVDLAGDACRNQRTARALRRAGPLVAASIGPYGAALADGSEYTGDYRVDEHALAAFHRRRLALLAASGADLLAIETIPSIAEARVLARLLDESTGPDAWVGFCCRDGGHLSDGTPIEDAVSPFAGVERVGALGVNCTRPEFVESLVRRITAVARGKDVVAYPNLGERWDPGARRWCGGTGAARFDGLAADWYRAGARIIGGCCRTTPEIIADTGRSLERLVGETRDQPGAS